MYPPDIKFLNFMNHLRYSIRCYLGCYDEPTLQQSDQIFLIQNFVDQMYHDFYDFLQPMIEEMFDQEVNGRLTELEERHTK